VYIVKSIYTYVLDTKMRLQYFFVIFSARWYYLTYGR